MGSKNLKAIAVRGTRGVRVKDPARFIQVTTEQKKVLADNGVTGQGLPKYGTQVLMNVINEIGALPTRNFQDVQFEGANKISAEAMYEPRPTDGKANLVTNGACFGCTIACGRISRMEFLDGRLIGANTVGVTQEIGIIRGLIQSRLDLGNWVADLKRDPSRLAEAYLSRSQNVPS